MWYKLPNSETYVSVKVEKEWKLFADDDYTYSYEQNGSTIIIEKTSNGNKPPKTQFYYKESANTTKFDALKTAVSAFIDNVATNSPTSNISIVKFANGYKSTEGNDTFWQDGYEYNYTQIVKKLTKVDTNGVTALKRAIGELKAGGATASDYGLNKAAEALEGAKQERVVILFTDGEPNHSKDFDKKVATDAVNKAKELKSSNPKTTIYTVGVFKNPSNDVNTYMSSVSSNYPNASAAYKNGNWNVTNGGSDFGKYYMNATSPVDLLKAFETISSEVSGGELGSKAILTDVIAPNFALVAPEGRTGVTAYTVDKTADGWSAQKTTLTNGVTVGTDGQVNVTGFDYSENCVTTTAKPNTTNDYGKKLVVEFTIHHNNYGGTQPTNAGASIKDEEGKEVIKVDDPTVPVKITKPSITGVTRSKVYDGTGFDVLSTIAKDINALADGKKNAYVDIVVTVTSGSNTYTYTIKKGDKSGSWDKTGLTTDKDVKIENGTVSNYTYDLSITFKDATANGAADAIEKTTATYTITKRPVTLTSETASKPYDGTPLTKPEVTVTDYNDGKNVFKNEVTDIKANGSVIDPGPAVTNAITYTPGANFKATNYNISKSEGKLSINDIAGPTNLPKVTVHCTNTEVVHADSDGNALTNGSYMSIVSKNATSNSYICTVTLTDKSDYINAYNTSTGATHVSDTSKNDTTEIVLTYDVTNKTWNAPTESFFLNVKCDTPTVNVTYEWTGLEGVVFDDDQHKAPTLPKGETVTKGSPHTVDFMYLNGSTVTDVHGNVYKFSGWDKSGTFTVQENTTIRGTWTKSTGTFELDGKIFKSFTAPDDVQKDFYVTVTPQQGATTDIRTGMLSLTGSTTTDVQFNFYNRSRITFTEPNTYTYLVEEAFDRAAHPDGIVDEIHYDTRQYLLTIVVDNNLNARSYFTALPQPDGAELMPTITFKNKYYEDPNADDVTLDLSKYVTKTFESRHGKSATETFEAKVQIWLDNVPIITNAAAEKDSIAIYAAANGEKVYDKTGTVTLSTGETKSFSFSENPVLTKGHKYKVVITEIKGSNPDVEYDTTEYNTWVTTYGGEISWWYGEKEFSFTNTYTGIGDYYPIIIPTIIGKDTGMLNKTDHFAYVIGYPDGTVHPNGQITRAEVATIFFRLLRDEVRDGAFTTSNSYSDVAYGKWYNNPISTMSALGIITGYPDGTFKPNKPITRAEFAAIAARFDETQSGKSATFSDVIGHWAAKEIGIAYYNDWIKGYPDGTFKPDQNITRAEAMTLINRVLERKPESPADLLTNMNKWTDNMDTSKWYYLDVQEATNSHGYTRKTFNYELWRQMLNDPDWSRYER